MGERTLYNRKVFPDYIFTEKVTGYLFVEFDSVFDEEFWQIMKVFLERNNIHKIVINNLEPDYHFIEEVDVVGLPDSFISATRTENLEGYFSFSASLHMITEKTLIYSRENEGLFCILLDREHSIGILGLSNLQQSEIFAGFSIEDVPDYLTLTFAGKDFPDDFKESLFRNWKLSSH